MSISQNDSLTSQKPFRVWPGVVAVAVMFLAIYGVPAVAPDGDIALYSIIFGGPFGLLAFIVWWGFFSRAPWYERLGAFVLMIVAIVATRPLLHKSIDTGAMGMMFYIYAIPVLCIALVIWAAA